MSYFFLYRTTFSNVIAFLCFVSSAVEEQNDNDENSYDILRQAVKEYWATMKEYYKAVRCLIVKILRMHFCTFTPTGGGRREGESEGGITFVRTIHLP